jgi:hypothetical protein
MSWVLNGRSSMIELAHELLFKLIIIFHAIFIVELLMIIWIEIIIIKIVLITVKVKLLLSLRAWSSIFSDWRFLVLAPSFLLNHFSFIIFFKLLIDYATRASKSLTWRARSCTVASRG